MSMSNPSNSGESAQRDKIDRQLATVEKVATATALVIAAAAVVFALSVAAHGEPATPPPDSAGMKFVLALSVSAAAVLANGAVGGFLGFLFGIPRLLARNGQILSRTGIEEQKDISAAVAEPEARAFLRSNTNLEEISDWLTKIIVGVGLIESRQIVDSVSDAQWFFSGALRHAPASGEFLALLSVASLVGSFLLFYLETRTRLALLFGAVESENARGAVRADVATKTTSESILKEPDPATSGIADAPLGDQSVASTFNLTIPKAERTTADERILKLARSDLRTWQDFSAWGTAQARNGGYEDAQEALTKAIEMNPSDVDTHVRLAEVQMILEDFDASAATLVRALRLKPADWGIARRLLLTALWQDPPRGFKRALAVVDEFIADPNADRDPWFHVWRAAAEGQRYRYFEERNAGKSTTERTELLKTARANALEAVKRAIELSPNRNSQPRKTLRALLHPGIDGSDPDDDDLEVFQGDEQFEQPIMG